MPACGMEDAIVDFVKTLLALVLILLVATASGATWARGHSKGSHSHSGSHHRSHGNYGLGYLPYGYTSTPAYSNRYVPSCARNPELEECVRERERVLPPQSNNASG